jgi:hypothetical protein
MTWEVLFQAEFHPEFAELPADIQDELLARLRVLEQFGPNLGRPHVDTLEGSQFANMKELRFQLDGVWRFAFAFDGKGTQSSFAAATRKARTRRNFIAI